MAILLLSICLYKFNLVIILNINLVRILYVYLYIVICVYNIENDVFDVFRDRRQTNLPYILLLMLRERLLIPFKKYIN